MRDKLLVPVAIVFAVLAITPPIFAVRAVSNHRSRASNTQQPIDDGQGNPVTVLNTGSNKPNRPDRVNAADWIRFGTVVASSLAQQHPSRPVVTRQPWPPLHVVPNHIPSVVHIPVSASLPSMTMPPRPTVISNILPPTSLPQPPRNVMPAASIPRNKPLPERPVLASKNALPFAAKRMSLEDAQALQTSASDAANANLDEFKKTLPNTPAINGLIEEAKNAIKENKSLDPTWTKRMGDAVRDAGGPVDLAESKKMWQKAVGAIEANKLVAQNIAALGTSTTGGTSPVIAGGVTPVIVVPELPPGMVTILPGGTLVVGSGGQGNMQVISANPSTLLGVQIGSGNPLPNVDTRPSSRVTKGILLRNPAENGTAIKYVVDSRSNYTLEPEFTHQLDSEVVRQIRFARGSGAGEVAYSITPGTYAFGPSDAGWDLFRETFSVTVDNSTNESEFCYVVDNRLMKVAAGKSRTHSSDFPIEIRFNRGGAGVEAVKQIVKSDEQLSVAISPADGMWDLYPISDTASTQITEVGVEPNASPKAATDSSNPQLQRRLLSVLKTAGSK